MGLGLSNRILPVSRCRVTVEKSPATIPLGPVAAIESLLGSGAIRE